MASEKVTPRVTARGRTTSVMQRRKWQRCSRWAMAEPSSPPLLTSTTRSLSLLFFSIWTGPLLKFSCQIVVLKRVDVAQHRLGGLHLRHVILVGGDYPARADVP